MTCRWRLTISAIIPLGLRSLMTRFRYLQILYRFHGRDRKIMPVRPGLLFTLVDRNDILQAASCDKPRAETAAGNGPDFRRFPGYFRIDDAVLRLHEMHSKSSGAGERNLLQSRKIELFVQNARLVTMMRNYILGGQYVRGSIENTVVKVVRKSH